MQKVEGARDMPREIATPSQHTATRFSRRYNLFHGRRIEKKTLQQAYPPRVGSASSTMSLNFGFDRIIWTAWASPSLISRS